MKYALNQMGIFLRIGKGSIAAVTICLAWPQIVLADVITGSFLEASPFFPLALIIESLIFILYSNVLLKLRVDIVKIIIAIVIANIVTSVLGVLIPVYNSKAVWGHGLLIITICALVLSAFIEWGVYIPFFRKHTIKSGDLLRISFAGNALTHSLLALILRFLSFN